MKIIKKPLTRLIVRVSLQLFLAFWGMPEELENQNFLNAFAKRIKSLRKEKGITQLDLAVKTGIDERQIQRIEAARTSTGIGNVYQMALAFGITISELFDFDPEGDE